MQPVADHIFGRFQSALRACLAAMLVGLGGDVLACSREPCDPGAELKLEPLQDEQPRFAAPTGLDRIGRVLAPVMVNGQGPFRFIVDTGANRTAISARLASALGLEPDPSAQVEVHGITGVSVVPVVTGSRIVIGDLTLEPRRLPVLQDTVFADADGILGIEGLQQSRLEVDFINDQVVIRRADGRRAPKDHIVVHARLAFGGLLVFKGRVGRVRADIILDTGAQHTIGNQALQYALLRTIPQQAYAPATVTGATPGVIPGIALAAPAIAIGDAQLHDVIVTFADLHVFSLWKLRDRPALVIGMDALGTVDRFVVDYRRKEFQFRPRSVD